MSAKGRGGSRISKLTHIFPSSCLPFLSFHVSCFRQVRSRAKCTTASQMCIYLSPSSIVLSQPFFSPKLFSECNIPKFVFVWIALTTRVANGRRRPLSLLVQSLDGGEGYGFGSFPNLPNKSFTRSLFASIGPFFFE